MPHPSRRQFLAGSTAAAVSGSLVTTIPRAAAAPADGAPGPVLVPIASATASSARAGAGPDKVLDGRFVDSSRWLSAGASDPKPVLTLTVAQPTTVARIAVVSGFGAATSLSPGSPLNTFGVEVMRDGAWTAVAQVTDNQDYFCQVAFAPVVTDRVRLVITRGSTQDTIARVFEVYLYSTSELPPPVRRLPKPGLRFRDLARLSNRDHRVDFREAVWEDGRTVVADVAVRQGTGWRTVTDASTRFDEQWAVLRGDRGADANYYNTMEIAWITFDKLEVIDEQRVRLVAASGGYGDFSVVWDLRGRRPELTYTLTAAETTDYIVGYHPLTARSTDEVQEVLCGPMQHAKVVLPGLIWPAWMMTAPFALVQAGTGSQALTCGTYVPASRLGTANEHQLGLEQQQFGMTLTDDEQAIRAVSFEPHIGTRCELAAGQSREFGVGLVVEPSTVTQTYERLLREEYAYTDYRRNVYGQSMTDTMYNIIDLIMTESDADDSVEFQPSPSGWWSRAKGFVDLENPQSVRTTSTSVLLSAYLITTDDAIYEERARPTIEFHVSRNGYGWTPRKGFPVYGDRTLYKMGSIPFDASTLAPLHTMTGGWNPAIAALATAKADAPDDFWLRRTPWSTAMAIHAMNGSAGELAEAEAAAQAYITEELDAPYTTPQPMDAFQYFFSRAWTELFVLYERTGNPRYLRAAHAEARRFVTQVFVRPVRTGTVTAPTAPILNHTRDDWKPTAVYDYPRDQVPVEQAPAWQVSLNGNTFEQLSTFDNRTGGYTLNPAWATFLLRLGAATDDRLLIDVARNAITGRYTNYPGYYLRQDMPQLAQPDYPLVGPHGAGAIYYTHIPAQLGMTIDWLLCEQNVRSRGAIDFPGEFEANYVWFKYRVYGHRPGRFYGDDGVWLWMPRGLVRTDNPQIDWISGEGNGKLYVGLTNASAQPQRVSVTLDLAAVGLSPAARHTASVIRDNGAPRPLEVVNGRITTQVSAKGITAIVLDGATVSTPLHRPEPPTTGERSYRFDDASPVGIVRGIILVKPDRSRYDAYVQAATESEAVLSWSTDGGTTWHRETKNAYPYEWTVPVPDLDTEFRYRVTVGEVSTETVVLSAR